MGMPAGIVPVVTHVAFVARDGQPQLVTIRMDLQDDHGTVIGNATRTLGARPPVTADVFTADGTQTAFVTERTPETSTSLSVRVGDREVRSGQYTVSGTGPLTVTLPQPPTKGTSVVLRYTFGPWLGGAAGVPPAPPTSPPSTVLEVLELLHAWATSLASY